MYNNSIQGLKESNIRVDTNDCTIQAVNNFNEIIRAQNYVSVYISNLLQYKQKINIVLI